MLVGRVVLLLQTAPITWTDGPPLPVPRDHHAVFLTQGTNGAYLHTIGGNTYRTVLADGWRAPIRTDGSVGPWEPTDSLPAARAGHTVVATERSVILLGGKLADRSNTSETLIATVRPDGGLGPWTSGRPMPGPRFHHAAASTAGFVYVTGGLEANTSVATVFRARVRPDGTLDQWTQLDAMPRPRSHHASFVHEGALYVVLGLDGDPAGANTPLKDVLRAPIRSDGSLGPWAPVSTMDSSYATHGTFVHGGFLYVLGGVENNARFVNTVLRAPWAADGTMGRWEPVTPGLPVARGHVHQIPLWRDRIYSLGGSANRQVMGAVHIGTLGSP